MGHDASNIFHYKVELIKSWFPATIDVLAPEVSSIRGELPAFLDAGSGGSQLMRLYEDGSTSTGELTVSPPMGTHFFLNLSVEYIQNVL